MTAGEVGAAGETGPAGGVGAAGEAGAAGAACRLGEPWLADPSVSENKYLYNILSLLMKNK